MRERDCFDAKVPYVGLGLDCEAALAARTPPPRTGGGAMYGEPPDAAATSSRGNWPGYDDFAFATARAIPV